MSDTRYDLPPVSSPNFLEKVRETLSVYLGNRGDSLNRGVTVGDLYDSGMVALTPGYSTGGRVTPISGPGKSVVYTPDFTPPPTPTGFAVASAISNILVECDSQSYTGGHGHAKSALYGVVWNGGDLPVFADAQLIYEFSGSVGNYATNPATTWHLWLKWVSADGVSSVIPAGGTNGLVVSTGQNVEKLVKAMTGPGNPFKIVSEPITLADGTVVPVGTYTADAYIHNSQITNAKIANLAVDNAKIANLSVSKLTAGSMAVGQYIQSTNYVANSVGWRISADGTAELANAVVRGAVYATAGYIGNNTIDANGIQSAGYSSGSAGWRLDSAGNLEANNAVVRGTVYATAGHIGNNVIDAGGIRSANYAPGYSGWRLDASGNLEANNGVFRGTLRANIVGSAQIVPNSATNIDAATISVPRFQAGYWSFLMHEAGVVVLFASADQVTGTVLNEDYSYSYVSPNATMILDDAYYVSGTMTFWLPAGWHSIYCTASADTYQTHYTFRFTAIKSYR